MISKTANLKHRREARQRRIKRQSKCGRLPQHTATERKRQALEWQAERDARQRRIRLIRRGAGVAFGAVGAGIMAGVLSLSPASAAGPRPAAQHHYYGAYVARQAQTARPDRDELPHGDGPDITRDGFPAPYIVTGGSFHPAGR